MNYFKKVKEHVDERFHEVGREDHLKHLENTVEWVNELIEGKDEALEIAAYSHDIQHAERWRDSGEKTEKSL